MAWRYLLVIGEALRTRLLRGAGFRAVLSIKFQSSNNKDASWPKQPEYQVKCRGTSPPPEDIPCDMPHWLRDKTQPNTPHCPLATDS